MVVEDKEEIVLPNDKKATWPWCIYVQEETINQFPQNESWIWQLNQIFIIMNIILKFWKKSKRRN